MHKYEDQIENEAAVWANTQSDILVKGHAFNRANYILLVYFGIERNFEYSVNSNLICSTFYHCKNSTCSLDPDPIENSKIENLWTVNTHFSTKLFCVSICILRFNQKWMWICECDWICWKMVKVGQVLFLTLLRNALWLSVYSTPHMYKHKIAHSTLILWSDGTREETVMSNKAAGKLYRVSICITHFAMWTKRWTQELENAVLACSTCRWQTSNYTSTLS